ncbi:hypothetical protein [Komagataeibacter sp. NFXK3]
MKDDCRVPPMNRMKQSVVAGKRMPDMVFADEWDTYSFCSADYLTEDETVGII